MENMDENDRYEDSAMTEKKQTRARKQSSTCRKKAQKKRAAEVVNSLAESKSARGTEKGTNGLVEGHTALDGVLIDAQNCGHGRMPGRKVSAIDH